MRKKNYKGVKCTKRYVEKCEDVWKITAQMQEINSEYDRLFERLKDSYESSDNYHEQTERQKQSYDYCKDKKIRDIITALSKYAGLEIWL